MCWLSHLSRVRLFATLWTVAHQALLSMGFSRQEYWSGSPCPPPGHLPDPAIRPSSLMSPALAGRFFTTSATWETQKERTTEYWVTQETRGVFQGRGKQDETSPWKPRQKEGRTPLSSGLYSWGSTHPKRSSYSSPGVHSWGSRGSNGGTAERDCRV